MRDVVWAAVLVLSVVACGGDAAPSTTSPPSTEGVARADAVAFASSAQRALEGTAFASLGEERVADLVVGLCSGLGIGAIGATLDGLDVATSEAEREIFSEVLTTGVIQVCPDRAPVDLTGFYLDAVFGTVEAGGADGAFVEGDVIRAGPIVCDALTSGAGVEMALLDAIDGLFAVRVTSIDGLDGVIDGSQGLVAGAVVASATAILCPEYAADVESFMAGL